MPILIPHCDVFSASVRRTSMREKGAMSLKEAKEERERLRESASSNEEEDQEEEEDEKPVVCNNKII